MTALDLLGLTVATSKAGGGSCANATKAIHAIAPPILT
jgi:hypothetical protein